MNSISLPLTPFSLLREFFLPRLSAHHCTIVRMSPQAGPLLISTWINTLLYGFVVALAYRYFRHFKDDRIILKLFVVACLLLDTACTAFEYAGVYEYTIVHWGGTSYMKAPNRTTAGFVFCTGITAFLVQIFLIYRFTNVTHKRLVVVLLLIPTLVTVSRLVAIMAFPGK
jgi:hypothetical protein